jgi:hypothetical protein
MASGDDTESPMRAEKIKRIKHPISDHGAERLGRSLKSNPVQDDQAPFKFELIINLKAAKALRLNVSLRCSPAPTRIE